MKSIHRNLTVSTASGINLHDITPQVRTLAAENTIGSGLLVLTSPHTTTGITINENEERLLEDARLFFARLAPPSDAYLHNDIELRDCPTDEPQNAHSHLVAMLVGSSKVISIVDGDLDLGRWQSIMLVELDGPRERTVRAQLFGE